MFETFLRVLREGADWVLNWLWEKLVQLVGWLVHWLLGNQMVRELVGDELREAIDRQQHLMVQELITLIRENVEVQIGLAFVGFILFFIVITLISRSHAKRKPR